LGPGKVSFTEGYSAQVKLLLYRLYSEKQDFGTLESVHIREVFRYREVSVREVIVYYYYY